MKALTSTARLIHPLILVSAAFLVCANGALAADFVGDAQMQARALLAATSGVRPHALNYPIATATDSRRRYSGDAQEEAQQLIISTNSRAGQVARSKSAYAKSEDITLNVSTRANRVVVDASEAARRMIIGLGG
jgi:hypothetical protein